MSNRKTFWRLIGAGFLLAGLLAFTLLNVFGTQPQLSPMVRLAPLVETTSHVLAPGALTVRGQGFVMPQYRVSLASQVSGEVVYVSPDLRAGGTFEADELLVQLDARVFAAAVKQTEGQIAANRAQITFARREVDRLSKLASTNSASASALGQQRSQLGRLEGELISLEAQLARNSLDMEYTELRAPFAGQVFEEQIDRGNVVQPGQSLAEIFSTQTYEVTVSLDDNEAALIPGLWTLDTDQSVPAAVFVDFGDARYEWPASVEGVEATIDQQTRTIDLIVRIAEPGQPGRHVESGPDSGPPLVPGMFVDVEIIGQSHQRMATLPRSALRPQSTIWTVSDDGGVSIRSVDVLQAYEDSVVVAAANGAAAFDVIVSELNSVSEGMAVRVLDNSVSTEHAP